MASTNPGDQNQNHPTAERGLLGFFAKFTPTQFLRNATKESAQDQMAPEPEPEPKPEMPPLTKDQLREQIKRNIDARFEERQQAEVDAQLKNPKHSPALVHRPEILPTDQEWVDFKAKVYAELASDTATVKGFIARHFEEIQIKLITPTLGNPDVLEIQNRNAKDYKESIGPNGRFHGEGDNLSTKLTLLHFGFPVEPFTLNNMLNVGQPLTADDPPDDKMNFSGPQRAILSQKPLEFLDVYNQRSHGYPAHRMAAPKPPPTQFFSPAHRVRADTPPDEDRSIMAPVPIFPSGSASLRGGAGPNFLNFRGDTGYIYSHTNGKLPVDHTASKFIQQSLVLLHIDPDSDWAFIVDQYDNQSPEAKKDRKKYLWDTGACRTTKITKKDQSAWRMSILPRVMHPLGNWIMAVDHVRDADESAPEMITIALDESPGWTKGKIESERTKKGKEGKDGASRTSGSDGSDGTDGTNGTNGTDGTDRRDGTNGTNGTNGTDGTDEQAPGGTGNPKGPPKQSQRPRSNKFTPSDPNGPRFNRDRTDLGKTHAKSIPKPYASWILEEKFKNTQQRQSYVRKESAVVPGRSPDDPIFGETRELGLTLGSGLPTVYAQHLTSTDVGRLLNENQLLRNQILDRMTYCTLCPTSFENYKTEEIKAHWREHAENLTIAGLCPLCADNTWIYMDTAQRREHLKAHQEQEEGNIVREFWNDLDCPGCDTNLRDIGGAEHIVAHLIDHEPGTTRFCQRCQLDLPSCTRDEILNHSAKCLHAPDKRAGEPDRVFCDSCGQDRTTETAAERVEHNATCNRSRTATDFCIQCGLNRTGFTIDQAVAHRYRCRPPRGIKRKFCVRCSINLTKMEPELAELHRSQCPRPRQKSLKQELTEIHTAQLKMEVREAANKSLLQKIKLENEEKGVTSDGKFKCPLPKAGGTDGRRCGVKLTLGSDAFVHHYQHHRTVASGGTDAEKKELKQRVALIKSGEKKLGKYAKEMTQKYNPKTGQWVDIIDSDDSSETLSDFEDDTEGHEESVEPIDRRTYEALVSQKLRRSSALGPTRRTPIPATSAVRKTPSKPTPAPRASSTFEPSTEYSTSPSPSSSDTLADTIATRTRNASASPNKKTISPAKKAASLEKAQASPAKKQRFGRSTPSASLIEAPEVEEEHESPSKRRGPGRPAKSPTKQILAPQCETTKGKESVKRKASASSTITSSPMKKARFGRGVSEETTGSSSLIVPRTRVTRQASRELSVVDSESLEPELSSKRGKGRPKKKSVGFELGIDEEDVEEEVGVELELADGDSGDEEIVVIQRRVESSGSVGKRARRSPSKR